MTRALAVAILALVSACSDFPQVDAALRGTPPPGAYPTIAALEGLEEQALQSRLNKNSGPALAARAARLRARARALQGPVLSPPERRRLLRAVQRHQAR